MLNGAFNLHNLVRLQNLERTKELDHSDTIDCSGITELDTAGAYLLLKKFPKARFTNLSPQHEALFSLVSQYLPKNSVEPTPRHEFLESLGGWSIGLYQNLKGILRTLGEVVATLPLIFFKRGVFRPKEFFSQLMQCLLKGIPIVALVTGLIGVVVAYLFASQAQKFGAYIFVVESVGIAMCRELSPVIASIIVAARSGSAFTAQIGAMKLNQELDAIATMGLSTFRVLVLPRVLALMVALPLLVFVGNVAGIWGGMLVAEHYLDVTNTTFLERLQFRLGLKHVWIGLIKAPVFAAIIAIIGCRFGFDTKPDARSVGMSTTAAVVYAVVLIIIVDAAFAVFFQEIKW